MRDFGLLLLLYVTTALRAAIATRPELPTIPPDQPFSFVVMGDNRGDDSGQQPPAFRQVLQAVQEQSPAFILDSGDMIYGHSSNIDQVRAQWRIYKEVIRKVRAPIFHVPGNHDIWDGASGRIYRELWGETYYEFGYGNTQFIGLDTESANGRLGEQQFQWLQQQLEHSARSNVFLFFHRPLFPVDGAIGSSLDEDISERDRLHKLLSAHRSRIRGVFAGHEHLYNYQQREGVPYYISGGAGAPLYTAPELGGFHHFLVVQVSGTQVTVALKKVCAPTRKLQSAHQVLPGELLEQWDQGLMWYAWDHTANIELTPERASQGQRGLRLNFDLNQYAWPVLVMPLAQPRDLEQYRSLSIDVFLPDNLGGRFRLGTALENDQKFQAPPQTLKTGWNTITANLNGSWLPRNQLQQVKAVEWQLSASSTDKAGYVVFDKLVAKRGSTSDGRAELLEGFERPLLWRVFDESVGAEIVRSNHPGELHGLRLSVDFSKCRRPVVFAQLNPPWDLTQIKTLQLQTSVGQSLPGVIALFLRAKDVEYRGPVLQLQPGTDQISFSLIGEWLPQSARAAVEQVGFIIESTKSAGAGEVCFQKLSAGDS